mmetsp:Transcript_4043/g.11902  ORF Transcript_4043/g.11902 Transcript_4043/m.11902 type:complete len:238 (+) Transcript_4043:338-1051(+)
MNSAQARALDTHVGARPLLGLLSFQNGEVGTTFYRCPAVRMCEEVDSHARVLSGVARERPLVAATEREGFGADDLATLLDLNNGAGRLRHVPQVVLERLGARERPVALDAFADEVQSILGHLLEIRWRRVQRCQERQLVRQQVGLRHGRPHTPLHDAVRQRWRRRPRRCELRFGLECFPPDLFAVLGPGPRHRSPRFFFGVVLCVLPRRRAQLLEGLAVELWVEFDLLDRHPGDHEA